MTEPTDRDSDLDEFEQLGRRAGAELRTAPPPDGVMSVAATAGRRRAIVVAAAAMALVTVVAGGFVLLAKEDSHNTVTNVPLTTAPTPATSTPATSSPATSSPATSLPTSDSAEPVDQGPFSIIATRRAGRDLDVLAIGAGGDERLIRTVSPGIGSDASFDSGGIAVSSAGWLSLYTTGHDSKLILVDLRGPAASTPRQVACLCVSGRWNAAGDRYAVVSGEGTAIIDPVTGNTTQVSDYYPVDGTPEVIWSADGTALLSTSQSSPTGLGDWSMTPIDGGPSRQGSAPLYWPRGTSYVDDRGRWIEHPYSGAFGGTVTVDSDTSEPEIWYDGELLPAELRDFSFTSTGDAIWLLLTDANDAGLELVRSTAPGEHEIVIPFVPFEALAGADFATIAAISPDDSILVAAAVHETGSENMVIETEGGAAFALPAGTNAIGFVPTAVANTFGIAPAAPTPTAVTSASSTASP
jgi:hypothetical protein